MVFALVLFCLFGQKERIMAYSDALDEIEKILDFKKFERHVG